MKLKQRIAKFLFKWHGWKIVGKPIPPEVFRCVFVFSPHTSNWDFYFGVMCMISLGVPIKVAIKKFWTKFPFSLLIKPLGGVGINRIRKKDGTGNQQVDMLADLYKRYDQIALIITPEGSRSLHKQWKTGFYHIAQKAEVPIVTLGGNYENRTVYFGPVFSGEESLEKVMQDMMAFFKNSVAKYPEEFSVDERYS